MSTVSRIWSRPCPCEKPPQNSCRRDGGDEIKNEISNKISNVNDLKSLNEIKVLYLGKTGIITILQNGIKEAVDKKSYGMMVNDIRNHFNTLFMEKQKVLEEEKLNELLHFLSAKKYSEMPDKQNRVLDYGALKINAEYRSVESNGELVQLTNYEFEILYLLAKNPGRIFSKEQIYTQVWKEPYYGAEDNVMGIIRRIRKKIEPDSAKPRYILNVWGMGYKFEVDEAGVK